MCVVGGIQRRLFVIWAASLYCCVCCYKSELNNDKATSIDTSDEGESYSVFGRPEIVIPYVYGGHIDDLLASRDGKNANNVTASTLRDGGHRRRSLHVIFYLNNTSVRLRVSPLHDLTTRNARVEWMETNFTQASRINRKCLYVGSVLGVTGSTATLNICDGMAGTIGMSDEDIYLKPVITGNSQISRPHYAWRRPRLHKDMPIFKIPDVIARATSSDTTANHANRRKRSLGQHSPKYLAVQLVTDKSVVSFHGRDLLEQYLLTQINIVNRIYHHDSLGLEINIVMLKIVVLDERTVDSIVVKKDGKATLDNFCVWSAEQRSNDVYDSDHFDIAVYLTKKKIGSAGFAPVDGMCVRERSCALIADDGISSAFVMAHEMAHVMGLGHDGYDNDCEKDPSDGKLMSAMVQSSYDKYYWSECSRERLAEVMPALTCLNDRPHEPNWPTVSQPFGRNWGLNKQCRQEFGAGYKVCKAFMGKDPCKQLWCSTKAKPLLCQTKKAPPLPGTTCGKGKWCMAGSCSHVRRVSVDGGWSSWNSWRECSKQCGTGVRFRSRSCNDPLPAYGGKKCKGNTEEFQLCNTQACAVSRDARAEQCSSYDTTNFMRNRRHHWMPMESVDGTRLCKLTCISKETSDVFVSDTDVIDGTFCSYNSPNGICIKGKCHRIGCDGRFGSNAKEDMCGVCGGTGTSCKLLTGTFDQRLTKKRYHNLFILPANARNIDIKEDAASPHLAHFIALRDPSTREFLLNGDERLVPSMHFIAHGTRFIYGNKRNGEFIRATGPLLAPVEVMVYSLSSTLPSTIHYHYRVPNAISNIIERAMTRATRQHYAWDQVGWSACSKTCGPGVRQPHFGCRDETTGAVVDDDLCSNLTQPDISPRRCKSRSCAVRKFRWRPQPWGPCSATCGRFGVQQRQAECYRLGRRKKPGWPVDASMCKDSRKIKLQRPCKKLKPCPAQWNARPWNKCKASCGPGKQTRRVFCDKPKNGDRYRCTGPRPDRVRKCTGTKCPKVSGKMPSDAQPSVVVMAPQVAAVRPPEPRALGLRMADTCPVGDRSHFCVLGANERTCSHASYRDMCCRSCRRYA